MGGLFSSKKKPASRVTEHDEAILQLKAQRDKLKQYQRKIEANLERERQVAKQLISEGKKERALILLKKKKYREKLIEQTMNQMTQLEQMVHDIEFTQIEMNVMSSLEKGNEALKKMHRLMSVEDVERILGETQEAIEYQHEIDSLISGELNDTDLSDVESELEALLRESDEKEAEDMHLPEVPDEPLPEVSKVSKTRSKERRAEAEMLPA